MKEEPKNGIEELDGIVKRYENGEISFTTLISSLWNRGYSAGFNEATSNACREIEKNYQPKFNGTNKQ